MTHQRTTDTREVFLTASTLTELGAEVDAAIENIASPWRFTGADVDCDCMEYRSGSGLVRTSTAWTATVTSERRV